MDEIIERFYKSDRDKKRLTSKDILVFKKGYLELQKMKKEFQQASVGRKEIADRIIEQSEKLKKVLDIFGILVGWDNNKYRYQDSITDIGMALRVVLRIANGEEEKYVLKKFYTTDFTFQETVHGDREHGIANGVIYVLSEKEVLESIDDKKKYFGSEFGAVTYKIVKDGHPMIIYTDHYYDSNVKPGRWLDGIKSFDFRIEGQFNDGTCYMVDSDLTRAALKFKSFIDKNGADIKGIPEEELFNLVNSEDIGLRKVLK